MKTKTITGWVFKEDLEGTIKEVTLHTTIPNLLSSSNMIEVSMTFKAPEKKTTITESEFEEFCDKAYIPSYNRDILKGKLFRDD